jgi:hypothetical protein
MDHSNGVTVARMKSQLGLTRVMPLGAGRARSDDLLAKNNQSRYNENDY